ncbi:hypothetical protein [Kribbella sp. CA-293567]|uniref:hypothetical protein n=1 Tax=Kribbella sp. CA-293567 TaxID=3002436 RepID=UPI0022DD6C62|nr:hypothetical protein [Kribbella sp. CA-293567]WBQ07547.1 hypothetical protein OX958_12250 [Kribbella sp. CA-293567]
MQISSATIPTTTLDDPFGFVFYFAVVGDLGDGLFKRFASSLANRASGSQKVVGLPFSPTPTTEEVGCHLRQLAAPATSIGGPVPLSRALLLSSARPKILQPATSTSGQI